MFINAPSFSDSRHDIFIIRLASDVPPSLPTVATAIITRQISQSHELFSRPIRVRRPIKAKKSGSSRTELKMFDLVILAFGESRHRQGITMPARKAPKSAWMPMISALSAERRTVPKTSARTPFVGLRLVQE